MEKQRNQSIELLRVLSIIGVIVLHYNNTGIGGAFLYTDGLIINKSILYFLESIFICAVNVFILINGYFTCTNDRRQLIKPLKLILQVIIYQAAYFVVSALVNPELFSINSLVRALIPANWFIILYVALYFISPLISKALTSINKGTATALLIALFSVVSVYPTLVDVFFEVSKRNYVGLSTIGAYGSDYGYTLINFLLMYYIGGYLRIHFDKNINRGLCFFLFLLSSVIVTGWAFVDDHFGFNAERTAWEYCNPLVVVNAVLIFLVFLKISIPSSKILGIFAKASFSVYLLNCYLFKFFCIEEFAKRNALLMVVNLCVAVLAIYLFSVLVHYTYELVFGFIFKLTIDKNKLLKKDLYNK